MNIYDLETQPIRRIDTNDPELVASEISGARYPLIFSGLSRHYDFLDSWDLDFFESLDLVVPAQAPESDGVNYFTEYFRLPMREFIQRIKAGESLYIGAREVLGRGGLRSDKDGLGPLADSFKIPSFVKKELIWSGNLWVGAGGNKTLLHYDPWDGLLFLGSGEKEFLIFPDSETPNMYQYGAFDFVGLSKEKVLHSKIKPMDVQPEFVKRFKNVSGYRGTLRPGEFIYIPAGFWHFVNSSKVNIGVNFFIHFENRKLNFREPLRTYWIKDNVTLWPYRLYKRSRRLAGRILKRQKEVG